MVEENGLFKLVSTFPCSTRWSACVDSAVHLVSSDHRSQLVDFLREEVLTKDKETTRKLIAVLEDEETVTQLELLASFQEFRSLQLGVQDFFFGLSPSSIHFLERYLAVWEGVPVVSAKTSTEFLKTFISHIALQDHCQKYREFSLENQHSYARTYSCLAASVSKQFKKMDPGNVENQQVDQHLHSFQI